MMAEQIAMILQRLEEQNQQLAALTREATETRGLNARLQEERHAQDLRLAEQAGRITELRDVFAQSTWSSSDRLTDSRGAGRPQAFDSKATSWHGWELGFLNYMTQRWEHAEAWVHWSTTKEDSLPSLESDLLALMVRDGVEGSDLSLEKFSKFNRELYSLLISSIQNDTKAQRLVANTKKKSGLEAWRRLGQEYDPMAPGQRRSLLSQILQPSQVKTSELQEAIEALEVKLEKYALKPKADTLGG